jgi:hypothetical protein
MDSKFLSHSPKMHLQPDSLLIHQRNLIEFGCDVDDVSISDRLNLFDQLCEFELGRFLILNKGLNAYWTNELVTWTPDNPRRMTELERSIFEYLPATLATRERYGIFRNELQKSVKGAKTIASVPCGVMSDLLCLEDIERVQFTGIDMDDSALSRARILAESRGLIGQTRLIQQDAWLMENRDEFDVLTSNGLNIYEPDSSRVIELYSLFHLALKENGLLIISFMTPPPFINSESSWKMSEIEPELLRLQKILFMHVIGARWNAMSTEAQTHAQLTTAGFSNIRVIYDRAGMFPTVLANKYT